MKKAELSKMNDAANSTGNGAAYPVAPSPLGNRTAQQPGADPSSAFRSSRYPVPQFEFRTQAAR